MRVIYSAIGIGIISCLIISASDKNSLETLSNVCAAKDAPKCKTESEDFSDKFWEGVLYVGGKVFESKLVAIITMYLDELTLRGVKHVTGKKWQWPWLEDREKVTVIENKDSIAKLAEEIERYRAKISLQHRFNDHPFAVIRSPKFFTRNIPFHLAIQRVDKNVLCYLVCNEIEKGGSMNVEYNMTLHTPSKKVQSTGLSITFKLGTYSHKTDLSEIFSGEEIFVNDAITLELSLGADEPRVIDFKPPKEKLRQNLQNQGNQGNDFERLLNSGDFSDVTLIVTDCCKFKAHKNILATRSEFFARMLSTDMKEAKNNEIEIDGMGCDSLKIMLHHIYTGQLRFPKGIKIDLKICQELANAGEKYNLRNLKEYAAMAMTEFVSLENAWELLLFTERLKAAAATKALASYYAENVGKIMEKL